MAWKETQNAEDSVKRELRIQLQGLPTEQFSDLVEFYVSLKLFSISMVNLYHYV